MHVFKRYNNPLKSARLRQYLYEGVEGWNMPTVAETVPGLVHVSLFLFFVGLGDSLFNANTTIGITTIIPISTCGLLYVFSMFAPVITPQSPFRNTFSGLIWYVKQKVHPRRYLDRASGGSLKAVSSNISEGLIQLAMEENDERKDRDVRAMRWLIHNRTEDDEMESFAMAIPGSFTSKWGIDVWRKVSGAKRYEDTNMMPNYPTVRSLTTPSDGDLPMSILPHHPSPFFQRIYHPLGLLHYLGRFIGIRITNGTPPNVAVTHLQSMPPLSPGGHVPDDPYTHGDLAMDDFCKRIRHLVGTCSNYSIFTKKELWLKRARGCVETAVSLVVCADVKPELLGDLEKLLLPVASNPEFMGVYHTTPGSDGLFVARWTCLSFVVVNQRMANHDQIGLHASVAIDKLSRFGTGDYDEQANSSDGDENALANARRIDEYFEMSRQFCEYKLRGPFRPKEMGTTKEQVREVLARDHKADISMLEHIALAVDRVADIDRAISSINHSILGVADGLIAYVRGVQFDVIEQTEPFRFFDPTNFPAFLTQFIFLHQRLRYLSSYSSKLREIINGKVDIDGDYQNTLESLKTLWAESDNGKPSGVRRRHLMERQLWRLQDFRDGGGFGFWVEVFFLVTRQLLTIPLSSDAHSALIVGTFRVITSKWRQHKHSIGTQRVVLNHVCDMAILDRGLMSEHVFPKYITDELLVLLGNMVEGQSGSHIDDALKELEDATKDQDTVPVWFAPVRLFRAEAVKVISRSRPPAFIVSRESAN